MCKKKQDKSYSGTSFFSSFWVICFLFENVRGKTNIHHFFYLFRKNIMLKCFLFFNSLIYITSSGGTFQSSYHFLQPLHFWHWTECNWWYTSIFRLKVRKQVSATSFFIPILSYFFSILTYLLCFFFFNIKNIK